MRSPTLFVVLASGTALADPAPAPAPPPATPAPAPPVRDPALTKLDIDELPDACRDLGTLAESASRNQALSARISLASCLVDQATKPLVLCDCEQSVRELEQAMEPSLALLEEVYREGDPATKILARHIQGELLASLAARMLATVPPPANHGEAAIALRDMRLQMLSPQIQPWLMRARNAFAELDRIARANPQLAKNPAVVSAVRASRARLSQDVAKR